MDSRNTAPSTNSNVLQNVLHASCVSMGAIGMLVTSRRQNQWRTDACYLLSTPVCDRIVSSVDEQLSKSPSTTMSLVQIGMNSNLCLSANTQSPAGAGELMENSRLIAVLSRSVEVTPRMISMLEAYAITVGSLNRHEVKATVELAALIESCAICDRLKIDESTWLRWDEYVSTKLQTLVSHTVCPTCLARHYPDLLEQEAALSLQVR